MLAMTLQEIADVVAGTVHDGDSSALVTGSAFVDSRKVVPGGLFVALPGERADGHDYAEGAVRAGAAAVLGSRPIGPDVPTIVVADGVAAIGRLAAHLVATARGFGATVVGVTGSAGKTTTKDLISHVLGTRGPTVSTPGNFNNEIGLPLAVTLVEPETRFLVLEMGARGVGHITYLTSIAPLDVGVVLNVGTAHIGDFGGVEAIARGKGELIERLPKNGLAVLNADDARVRAMHERTPAPVSLFGFNDDAEVRAQDVSLDAGGRARFSLHMPEGSASVSMQLIGEHQVANALAAAAVARHAGLRVDEIAAALSAATPSSRGRMEITERPDGVTVINDAYNANPHSMRAALRSVASLAAGRRMVAVLGLMVDLGGESEREHRELGALIAKSGIDVLITIGDKEGTWIADSARANGAKAQIIQVADPAEARTLLESVLTSGDVVLLKASNSVGLQSVGNEVAAQTRAGVAAQQH